MEKGKWIRRAAIGVGIAAVPAAFVAAGTLPDWYANTINKPTPVPESDLFFTPEEKAGIKASTQEVQEATNKVVALLAKIKPHLVGTEDEWPDAVKIQIVAGSPQNTDGNEKPQEKPIGDLTISNPGEPTTRFAYQSADGRAYFDLTLEPQKYEHKAIFVRGLLKGLSTIFNEDGTFSQDTTRPHVGKVFDYTNGVFTERQTQTPVSS